MKMKNEISPLYTAWLNANTEKTNFWKENVDNWTAEVAVTYNKLAENAERLFLDYRANATGRPREVVAAEMNDRIHSRFD